VVASIGGLQFPRAQMMRIRILDIWIHLQDIRLAIGSMSDLATDGAWIAAEQLTSGLPFVWAKQLAAPVGSSVHLVVTGPGPEFAVSVVVNDNGRGEIVEAIGSQPTVTATMDWLQYVQLAAGRAGALASANGGGVTLSGDPAIGQQLLAHFVVTP
jgi:hypothetical protein